MKYIFISFIFITTLFSQTINFQFQDIKNENINIKIDSHGIKFTNTPKKVILLDFWGLYCPPCIMTVPHLVELQERYKDDLEVIGIQVQGRLGQRQLENFINKFNINYNIVDTDKTAGFISIISEITKWQGSIPFMLLIDSNGKIRTLYKGLISQSELSHDIQETINSTKKQPFKL